MFAGRFVLTRPVLQDIHVLYVQSILVCIYRFSIHVHEFIKLQGDEFNPNLNKMRLSVQFKYFLRIKYVIYYTTLYNHVGLQEIKKTL